MADRGHAPENTKEMPNSQDMEEYLPGFQSPDIYFQAVLKEMVQCTQKANGIASSTDDFEFWSSYPQYSKFCLEKAGHIRRRIAEILHHQGVRCQWSDNRESLLSSADIDEKFEDLIEANDALLERVDSMLDEAAGLRKNQKAIMSPYLKQTKPMVVSAWNKKADRSKSFNLLLAKNIQRPQLKWIASVDNSNTPFVQSLNDKPNSLKPWTKGATDNVSNLENFIHQQRIGADDNVFESRHPYEYELEVFEPRECQLSNIETKMYKAIDEVQYTFVDTTEGLQQLSSILKAEKEFAIDLEAHSYRSFLGFVCLMQISTRDRDFLVDTLELRNDLHVLNESFTDPNILKVMHGADMDIGWLQRDFGLYIVNLFDTGQAARVLSLARLSLAFLLSNYCNIKADKQYQLADWRIRPLPDDMIKYAREDTHYLLYIKDRMCNELLQAGNGRDNILRSVYSRSKIVAAKVYEKPIFTPRSYLGVYGKYKRSLNPQQLHCFKLLFAWRDKVAREEDESTGYVLPNHMILSISEVLPKEPQGVIACCNPVPPIVKQRSQEIHALVVEARNFDPASVSEPTQPPSVDMPASSTDNEAPVIMSQSNKHRHEIAKGGMSRTCYSIKTGFELYSITGPKVATIEPINSLFTGQITRKANTDAGRKKAALILASFRSPFELFVPNTNKTSVDPSEIIEKWKSASKNQGDSFNPSIDNQVDHLPIVTSTLPSERPVKREHEDEEEAKSEDETVVSLRDMLPSKNKKKKPLHKLSLDSSGSEAGSGAESPVTVLSYEKTKKAQSFVPFDYSKTDMKKFSKKDGKQSVNLKANATNFIQEPAKTGVIHKPSRVSKAGKKSFSYRK